MVILDEKMLLPPPGYSSTSTPISPTRRHHPDVPPPPFSPRVRAAPRLSALPPHLLLLIVYHTFPQRPDVDTGTVQRQRKTLYWLATGLRLVSRQFYIACMHVLRSCYMPAYSSLVRPPYTSDPFPLASSSEFTPDSGADARVVPSLQRETGVLDLFIALKVREDVWADESELHLEREESFRDLFDLNQPRARVEDLVRVAGARAGVIAAQGDKCARGRSVEFAQIGVTFSPRRVGLVVTTHGARRTVVETERARDEDLELAARRLVKGLAEWVRG